ncbi:enoyl-CoA hydratase-related protein [Shimia aestuarii]|uniref:3-hydroxyacyl-CoA dehydrogenase n=1 Tax=Shimia aestuarii TaxID=254406 RepID=A0A1I4TKR0_9RHOB|nr:enoyl-CoA hydratase-related protein [Shimia aestuarii]SFM77322.1 3-hydroxyacyl-CoA dehydrogenase [Shimia aestuarii]
MALTVGYEVDEGVAVLSLQNPPVNALGIALRRDLLAAFETALADRSVRVIVLIGQGKLFCAGGDISEFGKPFKAPWVPELFNTVEQSTKPVIAAIHGAALGGGMELALACHYRVCEARARIGFPEVSLGLLPGAGGTQRAPRLCGAETALELMITGKSVAAGSGAARVFFDLIVKEGLREAAMTFAQRLVEKGLPVRRTRDARNGLKDAAAYQTAIAKWRKRLGKGGAEAPGEILRCVEAAALLPFDVGMAFERAAFDTLEQSETSRALRHVFFAENKVAKIPEAKAGHARALEQIGVIGGGTRGAGLVALSLMAGFEVVLVEKDAPSLARALTRLRRLLDRAVSRGQLSALRRDGIEALLHGKTDMVALSEADLVIVAAGGDALEQGQIFAQLDAVVKDGAVLASASPFADIGALAERTGCAEDVLGLHFSLPTQMSDLVEVAVGPASGADAVVTATTFARKLGKVPVRVLGVPGRIGGRLMAAYQAAADRLVMSGALPQEVDRAMRRWGMALGPYQLADVMGLERVLARQEECGHDRRVALLRALIKDGRLGRKTSKGWYRYDADGGRVDPEVAAMIASLRGQTGGGSFPDESDIQRLCLAAMANEGARMVEEGHVMRPGDIDVAMIRGFAFPRWRGGPMQAADSAGLLSLRNLLRTCAQDGDAFWRPVNLLDDLIKNGRHFSDLNG